MSFENVTTALQAFTTTGDGLTLTLPDARFVTFKVQGNGNVTAGAVAIECCPQTTPTPPSAGIGRRNDLDNAHDYSRSSRQGSGIPRWSCFWYFPRTDQHPSNRRNRNSTGHSA